MEPNWGIKIRKKFIFQFPNSRTIRVSNFHANDMDSNNNNRLTGSVSLGFDSITLHSSTGGISANLPWHLHSPFWKRGIWFLLVVGVDGSQHMKRDDAVVEVILIKITRSIYIEIPLSPPLQKGEAFGVPGFIEMLPFSLQASRVNSSDLQECYSLSYETLQDRNVFLIKRATTTTSGGAEPMNGYRRC